ncbi:T9SS type A sorting domain-containing protein [Hymenobacter sp. ASUV-10]|uniref:T9SS type A sorting domain-containing protein n=1 Tax=Hymenobacter aranciens TaxID=3063996 RepID=A0ABT9B9G9_9BACT|nr:T9SS type A sorting domain-containing protein [Hymenobacter sp. ASUV-10]MDO7874904.1 T9SS type A sorting domain-containing protein [Hymenobacter sp. ASUV-10]
MTLRYIVAGCLLSLGLSAQAQPSTTFGFEYQPAAKVVHGTDTLRHAWAGGMNTPQFSNIDLNADGQQDLFAFDRESSRSYTFLNVANGTDRQWQYAPQYESLFPDGLYGWVLLRDYDCDGRPDLFTNSNGDIRVFRNVVGAGGLPSFTLASNQLRFAIGVSDSNIAVGGYNMPALQDVNGDGKLDILTYDFSSSRVMELYLNTSSGTCGGALTFRQETNYWGNISSCSSCATYQPQGESQCVVYQRPSHTPGHNVLLLDLDGDGDQDLLDGLDNCPELVRLMNQGNATAASLQGAGISASYPAANPIRVNTFPAGYSVDTNFDGRADLVVAPNMLDNRADLVSMRNAVRLYDNTAASGAPAFTYRANGFLQNDMIDVSEAAAPTFGDISGDGLPDMLIGNLADKVNGTYRASLTYYQNVGTRTQPIFKLITEDYLGLSATEYWGIKPVLVDLNRDGALDLVFSAWYQQSGHFFLLLNTATGSQPAAYNLAALSTFVGRGPAGSGILPYYRYDRPCFTDVDNDGYVDLLIGTNEIREPGMSLRYFRNLGLSTLANTFELVNNDFGQIRDVGNRPVNLSPVVADFDGDGLPDLVTSDYSGTLRFFGNYRNQSGSFVERTDMLYNSVTGQLVASRFGNAGQHINTSLAAADLNHDSKPELFVGMEAGGIISYTTRNRIPTTTQSETASALALSVYPNPASTIATIETAMPTRLTLLDLTGRTLRHDAATQRRHSLDLSGLAAGMYLVRAEAENGQLAVQRLVVK